jgi:hypothetical protein
MLRRAALAIILSSIVLAPAAAADDRDVLAPYRFQAPVEELGRMERERALLYRNQLQLQQRRLDRSEALGRLDPLDRRLQLETQGELDRLNRIVRAPQPTPLVLPSTRPLPSLTRPLVPPRSR